MLIRKKKLGWFVLFAFALFQNSKSQVSPPGLGVANTASWFAFSVRQDFGAAKKWRTQTYVGIGVKSNPNNYNPFQKPAILVFNQEFYYQFKKRWYSSLAISYRRQNEYIKNMPFSPDKPSVQQEFRLYGRLFYRFKIGRVQLSPAFRQEFRMFYAPDFSPMKNDIQLRSRLRFQAVVPLNKNQTQWLTFASETFFATSKQAHTQSWSRLAYTENRFTFYYSISLKDVSLIFDFGYMNDLVGTKSSLYDVHYLSIDIMFDNPAKLFRRHKKVNTSL